MKSQLVLKFLFALMAGGLFGLFIQSDYEKWHRLGREAFLTYQAQRFDVNMANPHWGIPHVTVIALMALGFFALYEAATYAGARLFSLFSRKG